MISPPRRGDLYPGRLPSVRVQWLRLPVPWRVATAVGPLLVAAIVTAISVRAGITAAVLLGGAAAATAVYIKNRTDRHNAAVDRGEIRTIPDPGFSGSSPAELPSEVRSRAEEYMGGAARLGRVVRFDGGWIVRHRNPRDVALVMGDDGGWARFDPRTVTDLWAVGEYRAGRGRDG